MLDFVDVGRRTLESYRGVAPDPLLDAVRSAAEPLRGARVLHLNATPYGGGVSELLRSEVPLLDDLGIVADWHIIRGDERFFQVTKAIHNGLQGAAVELGAEQRSVYLSNARTNAAAFTEEYDFVFVHDPQPAAILGIRGRGSSQWIWRCHIDTSAPSPEVWEFVRPFVAEYDAAIFTMEEFVPPGFPVKRVEIIPPAIDPLSPKNLRLPETVAAQVLEWIGIRVDRPLVTQVSRFDPWKDPLGVIAAYRLARREIPNLQLALVGSLALDDPEGWDVYRRIRAEAGDDPLIHVFTNVVGVGNIEVNAFQRLSDVTVQKSLREGFGLVVSESLWKGTPVVAGRVGGIPLQMADGVGGILVDTVEECGAAIVALLEDPQRAASLGERGRDRVREHFLVPRLLLNELALLRELGAGRPFVRAEGWSRDRDPVCGMVIEGGAGVSWTLGEARHRFCSERCRALFSEDPARYLIRR
ncbi:glycosyltransferase [Anaeromyxobacter oryzisoli]|uniref:glycosyltransferase n=1 Tax=Anaeromyxobacter oryzisoli TaxID=2925408 RepID=UPI001F55D236|nr:glycosyltransferase [Anaeromyxobacter sp. SG63]